MPVELKKNILKKNSFSVQKKFQPIHNSQFIHNGTHLKLCLIKIRCDIQISLYL